MFGLKRKELEGKPFNVQDYMRDMLPFRSKKPGPARHTIGDVYRDLSAVDAEGKSIALGSLCRAIKRNYAHLLYRKLCRPIFDLVKTAEYMFGVRMRRELAAERSVLSEQLASSYTFNAGVGI